MSISKSRLRSLPDASLIREASERIPQLRTELLRWFRKNARKLPWRISPDALDALDLGKGRVRRSPYAAWIAEIMLQQTQVATVIPYYEKWMSRFPTADSLARSSEADVLQHWAGLGYYARARNLHKAAKILSAQGHYPDSIEGWLALPGIGPYTAGAITSLAFDLPESILDGNVTRVLSRVFGLAFLPLEGGRQKKAYWNLAQLWANGKNPGDANEALMELGALMCTPVKPRCEQCPLESGCQAFMHDWRDVLPPVKKRAQIENVAGVAVVGRYRGKILMMNRFKGSFLAGHNMFPLFLGEEMESGLREFLKRFGRTPLDESTDADRVRHSIMNRRYTLRIVNAQFRPETLKKNSSKSASEMKWISEKEIEKSLTNSLARKIWKIAALRTR